MAVPQPTRPSTAPPPSPPPGVPVIAWQELQIEHPVGRGSFGKVYKARWRGDDVAVKILGLDEHGSIPDSLCLPHHSQRELYKEAKLMARLDHPNVIGFKGLCIKPPCIVTEYCPRSSLLSVLNDASLRGELKWRLRVGMALDAAKGVEYLHSCHPPVVHRDLKSPNLLVATDWSVKVCDFGLSRILSGRHTSVLSTVNGANNPRWLAPELLELEGCGASTCSDVFAMGMVLWELLTLRVPWDDMPPHHIVGVVRNGGRPSVPQLAAVPGPRNGRPDPASFSAYCTLMRKCWSHDKFARPDAGELVRSLEQLHRSLPA